MFFKLLLKLMLLRVALTLEHTYDGYKVYDINAKNYFEKEVLLRLSHNPDYDFFTLPRIIGIPARVMIQPKDQMDFENTLLIFGIEFSVVHVVKSLKLEQAQYKMRTTTTEKGRISFTAFHRHSEINSYLDELARNYPTRAVVKNVGKSYEGREIKTITISNGDGVANKKVIFVDAGIHAREWIAPAFALYIINQLVENYPTNANLLESYDWVVLPSVNPDGYEYTFNDDRMWRKTRKPSSSSCVGTDGNRNFDFHWGEIGASNSACSDTFRGVSAFSEPETKIVRDILLSLTGRCKMYLTIHSFGNYLLYPWGYTTELPSTWEDMEEVAEAGASAILAHNGTKYHVGSSTNVLYAAAGGSDDYAHAVANIPISITMELPAGGAGFDPTPDQILPFVIESWIGVKAMAEKVIEKY